MRRRCKGKSSLCLFYFHFQHLYLIYFDQPRQAMCVEDEGAMHMGDEGTGLLGGYRDLGRTDTMMLVSYNEPSFVYTFSFSFSIFYFVFDQT